MDALQFPDPLQRRRQYSAAFKAQLIAACLQPGISIASMAIANQVNSSLLQRWVRGYQRKKPAPASITPETQPAFIPVEITPVATPTPQDAIRLELRRDGLVLNIDCPVSQAQTCAELLRELLR